LKYLSRGLSIRRAPGPVRGGQGELSSSQKREKIIHHTLQNGPGEKGGGRKEKKRKKVTR